jgi:hypothetical protein
VSISRLAYGNSFVKPADRVSRAAPGDEAVATRVLPRPSFVVSECDVEVLAVPRRPLEA